ncbi:hypothetical protein CDL15_Pgr018514 [Punica granatum]|uniref:Cytochrome P450 89A2-like n=1 Tax=Punica granatum TaxID=22663 RepID=A0A218WYI5_PUNGR|nr:hypothetical protein CDL15_Pgr018514 [Punica granatum]
MDSWFLLLILSLGIAALFKAIPGLMSSPLRQNRKLPPGPLGLPFISDFFWVRKSLADLEPILRALHAKHGPVVALHQGGSPAIFVASHALAHHALVQSGATFADRPPTGSVETMLTSNQRKINSARYGPMWRLLRRNLTAEILHPTRVRSYSPTRERVLEILLERLRADEQDRPVVHFQYAMFCLLVLMCFGDGLKERQIREVEEVQRGMLLNLGRFEILNMTKAKEAAQDKDNGDRVICYVDTLLDLELPEEKRKLKEDEILHLCSEFLNGGTDTTYTALQWIMANIVKYPAVQDTLYDEIRAVIGPGAVLVEEEDLQRLPYLKAVVLEGLRRHPPAHFVLPHAVTEDTELGGYLVPRKGTVNFMVAEMGWDPKVWEDPLAFRPERFLSNSPESGGGVEGFDITGSREIRMMPFGAGRRMCPGYALALLHLEYFVGNLVSAFEWKPVEGDGVDLSEKQEFTVVMKNPLEAILIPRSK